MLAVTPVPFSPQKAHVRVPKVGQRSSPVRRTTSPPLRGRRTVESILAEMKASEEAALAAPVPVPKGEEAAAQLVVHFEIASPKAAQEPAAGGHRSSCVQSPACTCRGLSTSK